MSGTSDLYADVELLFTMWKDVGPAERDDLDGRAERELDSDRIM